MGKVGTIEYKIPYEVARNYLKDRHGKDVKTENNAYLCRVVNEEYGLIGKCVNVILF